MTNRFYNLPENIISSIYRFDPTFRDKFKKEVIPEFLSMMYKDERICTCCVCRVFNTNIETNRLRWCFKNIHYRQKQRNDKQELIKE